MTDWYTDYEPHDRHRPAFPPAGWFRPWILGAIGLAMVGVAALVRAIWRWLT